MLKKMQQQYLKGASSAQNSSDLTDRNEKIEKQMDVLIVNTFKQYSQLNSRLTNLYESAKIKNQKLLKVNLRLRQDLSHLKHYCTLIEAELEKLGFQKSFSPEMLTRKETAEGILLTYDESSISEDDNTGFDQGYSQFQSCITQLEQENQKLKDQLHHKRQPTVCKSVQASSLQVQSNNIWHKAYEVSQEKVLRLEWQVRQLKKLNDNLQMQKRKKGITSFIMEDRKQIFNNIHKIISDYKKKIKQLASQKKDAYKKYKHLKQKLNTRLDQTSQLKLLQIYTEKVDILQKLTEKQQIQIENTIQLYEVQLKKIQQRRQEQINVYDNNRLDLETQNLKLHIDLQKSLNKRDDATRELMQQKNKRQILLAENAVLLAENAVLLAHNAVVAQKIQGLTKEMLKKKSLHFHSNLIKIDIEAEKKLTWPQKQLRVTDDINKEEQLNVAEHLYTSHIFQKKELQEYHIKLPKRQNSLTKNLVSNKITITYNQPYLVNPAPKLHFISSPLSSANLNKTYDSILQYKKKFIQRKPQSSFNQ